MSFALKPGAYGNVFKELEGSGFPVAFGDWLVGCFVCQTWT